MKNGVACIYARVSTIDGKQDYSRQVDELKSIILSHGYSAKNIVVYAETISGYKKNEDRPELFKLLNALRNNPKLYNCIYIGEISRLGRDPKQTRELVDEFTELGIPIYIQSLSQYTIEAGGKRNMMMNIILQVLIEYSNFEAETFKTRSKSGLLKSARSGIAGGGKFYPYGYKKDEKSFLVIDEDESIIIKRIFELYKEGYGIKVISNILNGDSVPTRTNKLFGDKILNYKIPKQGNKVRWSDKQIHDIIQNPIYIGQRRYKNELLSSPSIIDKELFNYCNNLLKTKTTRNNSNTHIFLLKNIVKCGVCGRNYFGRYKLPPKGEKVYKCSSTLKLKGSCGNVGLNIKFIESVIFHQIVESDSVLKYINNTDFIKKELEKSVARLNQSIELSSISKKNKLEVQKRLLRVHTAGDIPYMTFKKENSEITNEIQQLDERLSNDLKILSENQKSLKNLNKIATTKKKILKTKNNRTELGLIFNQLIEKVVVNTINNDTVLCTIFIKIESVVLPTTVQVLLDIAAIRKSKKIYRYKSMSLMENYPIFKKNNVLVNNVNDIKNEFDTSLLYDWINIKSEFLVDI